jgi:hypothetical protein
MQFYAGHLDLGTTAIRITFSSELLATQAREQVVLVDHVPDKRIQAIDYLEDDSVQNIVVPEARPNAVLSISEDLGEGRTRIVFNLFAQFTFLLFVQEEKVTVHCPSATPPFYLLDEVLLAALTPLLTKIGGFLIHGSCVVKDGEATAFLGQSGSGKSSTAFNLTRFGFQCYADDWVPVTCSGDRDLLVWPVATGCSIRPLCFRFFQEQGIQLAVPRREPNKYFFPTGEPGRSSCAVLKQICFVEPNGELNTAITRLDAQEALQALLGDRQYFPPSFQRSAPAYSEILVARVPKVFRVGVGLDLDDQGRTIGEKVFGGGMLPEQGQPKKSNQPDRKYKVSLIQEAWSSPGREPLRNLIPLLGDYDLRVVELAYAFFLNYPPARLESLCSPSARETIPQGCEASWMRTSDWLEGSRMLAQQSGVEVFRQYCLSWFNAAPQIYPFLHVSTARESAKNEVVQESWLHYRRKREESSLGLSMLTEVHIADFPDCSRWLHLGSRERWSACFGKQGEGLHLVLWLSRTDRAFWEEVLEFFKIVGFPRRFTVVPVCSRNGDTLTTPVEFIRFLGKTELAPKISRLTPLCRLTEEDATYLLSAGAMETAVVERADKRYQCSELEHDPKRLGNTVSCREVSWMAGSVSFLEKPFSACDSCSLYPLGLCLGGFWGT